MLQLCNFIMSSFFYYEQKLFDRRFPAFFRYFLVNIFLFMILFSFAFDFQGNLIITPTLRTFLLRFELIFFILMIYSFFYIRKRLTVSMLFIFLISLTSSTVLYLNLLALFCLFNMALDKSIAQTIYTNVNHSHIQQHRGKRRSPYYYLNVKFFNHRFRVTREVYFQVAEGFPIRLQVKQGAFLFSWVAKKEVYFANRWHQLPHLNFWK